jgi:hypothetical protein
LKNAWIEYRPALETVQYDVNVLFALCVKLIALFWIIFR